MKKIILIALFGISTSSFAALLGESGNERCGIGSMIFKNGQSISSQYSENMTNASLGETFSVTTGTSGCSNSGFAQVPQEELFYANANYEELQLEMTQGHGEVLDGLAATMGCETSSSAEFQNFSKSNFSKFKNSSNTTPLEFMVNFREQAKLNHTLSKNCRSMRG